MHCKPLRAPKAAVAVLDDVLFTLQCTEENQQFTGDYLWQQDLLFKNSYYGIFIRLIMSLSFEPLPLATFAVIIQSTSRDQFSLSWS
jgi:hypothetical protein